MKVTPNIRARERNFLRCSSETHRRAEDGGTIHPNAAALETAWNRL
jgi:hypothetical protein